MRAIPAAVPCSWKLESSIDGKICKEIYRCTKDNALYNIANEAWGKILKTYQEGRGREAELEDRRLWNMGNNKVSPPWHPESGEPLAKVVYSVRRNDPCHFIRFTQTSPNSLYGHELNPPLLEVFGDLDCSQ
jgi:hypothetical protein